jgi:hypothetical protein
MAKEPPFDLDKAHHWFGIEYNNGIFPLLEKADRTDEETEKMIAMAYASTLHWSSYSKHTIANRARGENMIATALAYAGRKEAAMHHAERNYKMVSDNRSEVADFDISYALMVMARACALNGDMDSARKYHADCEKSISLTKDPDDKKILEMDFIAGPWYGLK